MAAADLEDDVLLKTNEARAIFRVSRTTWFEGVSSGRFPKSIKFGPRDNRYSRNECLAYVARLIAERDGTTTEPTKRPVGRPKKTPQAAPVVPAEPARREAGRPKKNAPPPAPAPARRGRGRPRKTDRPTA